MISVKVLTPEELRSLPEPPAGVSFEAVTQVIHQPNSGETEVYVAFYRRDGQKISAIMLYSPECDWLTALFDWPMPVVTPELRIEALELGIEPLSLRGIMQKHAPATWKNSEQ